MKLEQTTMDFDGSTYEPDFDRERLSGQYRRVYDLMSDGKWRTLAEIEAITGDPQASISARLRDFRKHRFGGHTVERVRINDSGTWAYRIAL